MALSLRMAELQNNIDFLSWTANSLGLYYSPRKYVHICFDCNHLQCPNPLCFHHSTSKFFSYCKTVQLSILKIIWNSTFTLNSLPKAGRGKIITKNQVHVALSPLWPHYTHYTSDWLCIFFLKLGITWVL